MSDVQNFAIYSAKFKKIHQIISLAFQRRQQDAAYADRSAFLFVMRAVLANFLALQKNRHLSRNCFSPEEPLDCWPFLIDFPQVEKTTRRHDGDLNIILQKIRRELDSLCAESFNLRGRNILGDIYECLLESGHRKRSGQYYTPVFVVDYILSQTLNKANLLENSCPKILDPACGCGHFLLKAYDLLKDKFRENLPELRNIHKNSIYQVIAHSGREMNIKGLDYWQEENIPYHILRHCLFGADVDKNAVSLTTAVLLAKDSLSFSFLPTSNIICCDSLLRPQDSTHPDFPFWSRKYDYILGNPPYVSFGLKGAGKLKTAAAEYLRRNYPHSAQYKISYYALFFERSIELLAPGGKLGFITPDSFLLGRYFSKIRRFILDNCLIDEFFLLNQPIFTASIGFPVISVLTKTGKENEMCAAEKPSHSLTAKKCLKNQPLECYAYPQNYFEKQAHFKFRLFFNRADKDIIDKMDLSPYLLSHFAKIKTGMRSLTSQKDLIKKHGPPLSTTLKKGIISSSEIKPFFIDYQGHWLDVDPSKLNAGGWDKDTIKNPKILIRQTGFSLIAAIDEKGLYHLNNVHSISLINTILPLEYLLCIINSKLMNYYYQKISLEAGRPLAQTDIETLEKLPIAACFEQRESFIAAAKKLKRCLTLYSSLKNGSSFRKRLLLSSMNRLQVRLNSIVYSLYGLTDEEISRVENSFK